jgi:very-short-patch-repair endonuclease
VGVPPLPEFNRTEKKTARARGLRRAATEVEARLWSKLKGGRLDGLSFRRQHPAGAYVLDFYSPQLRLSIELDGSQHGEAQHQVRDERRSAWLRGCGVTELRFWNNDITQNLPGVLEAILSAANELRARGGTPTRRWRHSRCFASAFLWSRTAADGRLCLPLAGGG